LSDHPHTSEGTSDRSLEPEGVLELAPSEAQGQEKSKPEIHPSSSPPSNSSKPSLLKTLAFVSLIVFVFVAVATATAVAVMARRGTLTLPWESRSPRSTASPSGSPSGTDTDAARPRVPPTGTIGTLRGGAPLGGNENQTGEFESELGYMTRIPPGWTVTQKARIGSADSEIDVFTNGREGDDYAVIQVLSLQSPGLDPLAAASQVATKASSQQGYSIMVQPQKTKFAKFDAASFRAYAVQSGFPLIVEVYVVAGPEGQLLQVQFASSLEGIIKQASAFSAFQERFEFASVRP